jgi:hypothetical protein
VVRKGRLLGSKVISPITQTGIRTPKRARSSADFSSWSQIVHKGVHQSDFSELEIG